MRLLSCIGSSSADHAENDAGNNLKDKSQIAKDKAQIAKDKAQINTKSQKTNKKANKNNEQKTRGQKPWCNLPCHAKLQTKSHYFLKFRCFLTTSQPINLSTSQPINLSTSQPTNKRFNKQQSTVPYFLLYLPTNLLNLIAMFNTSHFHPMIVHFPVALILVGFLADVAFLFFKKEVCLSKTGLYLMVLGTLGAAAAFLTGNLFTMEPTAGPIVEIFERHETLALVTLLIMTVGTLIRVGVIVFKKDKPLYHWLVFGLYFLGAVCVGITGFLGGSMVMDYMIGL
jgi:uncharacterized membrane protein